MELERWDNEGWGWFGVIMGDVLRYVILKSWVGIGMRRERGKVGRRGESEGWVVFVEEEFMFEGVERVLG